MYKALDVREVIEISSGSVSNYPSYYGSNSMSINTSRKIVVIAEDENKKRKRFHFYDSYKDTFLGKPSYYGYEGDFDLLVPGDNFEVEETSTWPNVRLIKEN
jgi:hypothetical protein